MNESYKITILDSIAKALNSGRSDVTVFIISFSVVVIAVILLSLILSLKNKSDIRKSSVSSFNKLVRKFNLPILEIDLLEELSHTLVHPEKKYLLLTNKGTFRFAVQKTKDLNKEKIELLESLSRRLGFSFNKKIENIFSTKLFKPGMPVMVAAGEKHIMPAVIYSVHDSGFTVKYTGGDYVIKEKEHLEIIVCAFNGFKIYSAAADKVKDNLFSTSHAEPEKISKRELRFKVLVENEREERKEYRTTKIVFLAENGAALLNTPDRLRPGDDIKIFMDNDLKHTSHVNAEVIKAPITSKLVTVRFAHTKR